MLSSVVREEVRGAAIGDCETVEMCVPVKEVTPVIVVNLFPVMMMKNKNNMM